MPTKTPIDKIDTVDAFLESLQHPLKPAVLLLRQIFQQADPSINESIKWNVPSFSTSEYFATMHLRNQNRIGVKKTRHQRHHDQRPGITSRVARCGSGASAL
jgi:hypothetical protein